MEVSLTQEQKLFVRGLKAFGCSLIQTLTMAAMMWHPDDLSEMIEYMVEHTESTPEQLYEVCSKMSSKRPRPDPEI